MKRPLPRPTRKVETFAGEEAASGEEDGLRETAEDSGEHWTCSRCSEPNAIELEVCGFCYAPRFPPEAAGADPKAPPGDWSAPPGVWDADGGGEPDPAPPASLLEALGSPPEDEQVPTMRHGFAGPGVERAWRMRRTGLEKHTRALGCTRRFRSWETIWSINHGSTPPESATWGELTMETSLEDFVNAALCAPEGEDEAHEQPKKRKRLVQELPEPTPLHKVEQQRMAADISMRAPASNVCVRTLLVGWTSDLEDCVHYVRSMRKCHFSTSCTDRECPATHPNGRTIDNPCAFSRRCKRWNCAYLHPDGRDIDVNPTIGMCRNGTACTQPDCMFLHPGKTHPNQQKVLRFKGM